MGKYKQASISNEEIGPILFTTQNKIEGVLYCFTILNTKIRF